jgi:hypothetical protein
MGLMFDARRVGVEVRIGDGVCGVVLCITERGRLTRRNRHRFSIMMRLLLDNQLLQFDKARQIQPGRRSSNVLRFAFAFPQLPTHLVGATQGKLIAIPRSVRLNARQAMITIATCDLLLVLDWAQ